MGGIWLGVVLAIVEAPAVQPVLSHAGGHARVVRDRQQGAEKSHGSLSAVLEEPTRQGCYVTLSCSSWRARNTNRMYSVGWRDLPMVCAGSAYRKHRRFSVRVFGKGLISAAMYLPHLTTMSPMFVLKTALLSFLLMLA